MNNVTISPNTFPNSIHGCYNSPNIHAISTYDISTSIADPIDYKQLNLLLKFMKNNPEFVDFFNKESIKEKLLECI